MDEKNRTEMDSSELNDLKDQITLAWVEVEETISMYM